MKILGMFLLTGVKFNDPDLDVNNQSYLCNVFLVRSPAVQLFNYGAYNLMENKTLSDNFKR